MSTACSEEVELLQLLVAWHRYHDCEEAGCEYAPKGYVDPETGALMPKRIGEPDPEDPDRIVQPQRRPPPPERLRKLWARLRPEVETPWSSP